MSLRSKFKITQKNACESLIFFYLILYIQGYTLCVLDYEFNILDNAFLTHKPGIKTLKKDPARQVLASKTYSLIKKVILPELKVLYGVKKGCAVQYGTHGRTRGHSSARQGPQVSRPSGYGALAQNKGFIKRGFF